MDDTYKLISHAYDKFESEKKRLYKMGKISSPELIAINNVIQALSQAADDILYARLN